MGTLFSICEWVKKEGSPDAIDRLRVKILAVLMKEGVTMKSMTKDTVISPGALKAVSAAASEVVGKPCTA